MGEADTAFDVTTSAGRDELSDLYRGLRRFAAVVAPLTIDPDDLLHDAVVRAAQVRPLGEFENLAGYLRTTMINLVRSQARRDRVRERVKLLVRPSVGHEETPDLSLLDVLAPQDRALLFLVDVEGYSFDEAADLLEITPAAARQRAVRARRRLRGYLHDEEGDDR